MDLCARENITTCKMKMMMMMFMKSVLMRAFQCFQHKNGVILVFCRDGAKRYELNHICQNPNMRVLWVLTKENTDFQTKSASDMMIL